VRAAGLLSHPGGAPAAHHICWVYDDDAAFVALAVDYLAEGLARGEQLMCVGSEVLAGLRSAGVGLADVDALIDRGVLRVLDVGAAYAGGDGFTPERQLAFYDEATRQALDDGYRGLRVIAELSPLAADPRSRPDLLRWEHLADDFMGHGSGMVALCAYRSDLDGAALADLASVHPQLHTPVGDPPFRLWFDGDTLVLTGALDTFGAERLHRVLAGSHLTGPVVVADLSRVEFVDVGGCRALALWARELADRSGRLELVGSSRVLRRMWQLLGFDEYVDVVFREPVR
jgi:ABC-type transporter Mla MlaB component